MADIRVRVRDGCRGGREQFKWDSVKEQSFKDREQYLGQSTKVGVMGKFGQYYRHDWFAKKRDSAESIANEKKSIQKYEEELMQEALGLKPKKLMLAKTQLSQEELNEYLTYETPTHKEGFTQMGPQNKKGGVKEMMGNDEDAECERGNLLGEGSVRGIGFAVHRTSLHEELKTKVMGTEGELKGSKSTMESILEKYKPLGGSPKKGEAKEEVGEVKPEVKAEGTDVEMKEEDDACSTRMSFRGRESSSERRKRKKEKKKDKKDKKERKLKKAIKKADKAARKARKAAKTGQRRDASSSSESSSS